jgi:VanZ family protein
MPQNSFSKVAYAKIYSNGTVDPLPSLIRVAAWACLPILAIASWTPGTEMVRTGIGGLLEHLAAYILTGALFGLAFPNRHAAVIAVLLSGYAGVLEFGQTWSPGRHPAVSDWFAGVFGAWVGVFATTLVCRRWRK